MEKLRVLSLFSGIGAFEKALTNLNIDYELVNYCEIDKYASKSYVTLHNVSESLNLGDITKVDLNNLPQNIDLLTHGSPCQTFSVAGKGGGGDEGSNTRSSLMWNSVEIIKNILPKVVIWENVKNVLSKTHKHNFDKYINVLESLGYTSSYKVLNTKDYNLPQNRERIFVISRLNNPEPFKFPEPVELQFSLMDFLDLEVEQRYYIETAETKELISQLKSSPTEKNKETQCKILSDTHAMAKTPKNQLILEGTLVGGKWDKLYESGCRVYSAEGIAPTIPTCAGGNTEPKVGINMAVLRYRRNEYGRQIRKEYDKGLIHEQRKNMRELVPRTDNITNTITTVPKDNLVLVTDTNKQEYVVRKLTPKECWLLQGFSEQDYLKALNAPMSAIQLYKQAGNSISVSILENIFKNLYSH